MRWPGIEHWSASAHAHELRCLDWDELRWLSAHGWEIGSHTCSHPRLTELSEPRVMAELSSSRQAIESALRTRCGSLAYPYGAVDDDVIACAAATGYDAAAVLGEWPGLPRPFAWPRLGVYRADAGWRFRAKLSPTARRFHAAAQAARP